MTIIVIDFETANSENSSACSLGMVFIEGINITDEKYFLIQPPENYVSSDNTKIHGITADDLKDSPSFDLVWKQISHYFNGDFILAAHNAYFDMNVLINCLLHYEITVPSFAYFDSIPYSNVAVDRSLVGSSLKDRANHFGINLLNAHNALDDARATAELIIKCTKKFNYPTTEMYLLRNRVDTKEFADIKVTGKFIKRKKNNFKKKEVNISVPENIIFDETHPFFQKNIVFTGDLKSLERNDAAQLVVNAGGIIKSGVSSKTHYLVVGVQDEKLVGAKGVSTKEIKAAELIEKGVPIMILDEVEFINLLSNILIS